MGVSLAYVAKFYLSYFMFKYNLSLVLANERHMLDFGMMIW